MSKHRRGNKEAKKPKKVPVPAVPAAPAAEPTALGPGGAGQPRK